MKNKIPKIENSLTDKLTPDEFNLRFKFYNLVKKKVKFKKGLWRLVAILMIVNGLSVIYLPEN